MARGPYRGVAELPRPRARRVWLRTDATRLVLDFAFRVLQLRNVLLETLDWNVAGLTALTSAPAFAASASGEARL